MSIDGAKIPAEPMTFVINGRQYLAALPALHDEWWFILDETTLYIQTPVKFAAGSLHEINVELGSLLPHILVGPTADPLYRRVG